MTIFKYLLFSQTGLVGRFQYKGRLSFLMIIFGYRHQMAVVHPSPPNRHHLGSQMDMLD